MKDERKTKKQLVGELEALRDELSEVRQQKAAGDVTAVERELAVERVRAEAMAMRSSQDLTNVVAVLYREMLNLGLRTYGASIQFVEAKEERILTYFAFPNPRKDGIDWTSPDLVEYDQDIVVHRYNRPVSYEIFHDFMQRWQEGKPWSFTTDELFEKWAALAQDDLGMERPPPAPETVAWTVTNVPFAYGSVGFDEPELNQLHIAAVQSQTDALALGYTRFLDLQELEEQNQALAKANTQIQEANRHKSDFLARMSHDLRTPMNAIIGYTRILLRRAKDALEDRQYRNLENIQTSADNLLNLINEILDLSRIEAGRIDLRPEPVDLGQLVGDCMTSVAPLAKPGVELVQEVAEAQSINTDSDRIRRVIMNLLGNAVKFTEKGSITVSLHSVDQGCELSVADTGVGIPAEDLPFIFEEFRQVERQVGDKTEGTGLGLAIAKKSVDMLGGTISAESEVGKGTRFTLRIGDYEQT